MRFSLPEIVSLIPVDHLSYSAVRDFLEDRRRFKKKWIDLIWDEKKSLPLIEGIAYHAGVAAYWEARKSGETSPELLLAAAMGEVDFAIDRDKAHVDWKPKKIAQKDVEAWRSLGCEIIDGADSSGRKAVYAVPNAAYVQQDVRTIITQYIADPPDYAPVGTELAHTAFPFDVETKSQHIVPLKAKIDLVSVKDGVVTVVDHKLNAGDPDRDEETGELVIAAPARLQAAAYDSIIRDLLAALKIEVKEVRFVFSVMNKKTTKRTEVPVEITDRDRLAWSRLYHGAIIQMALASAVDDWRLAFLPNPFVQFGNDGWDAFLADLDEVEPGKMKKPAADAAEPFDL